MTASTDQRTPPISPITGGSQPAQAAPSGGTVGQSMQVPAADGGGPTLTGESGTVASAPLVAGSSGAASAVAEAGRIQLRAASSGTLEVFVNGQPVGATSADAQLLSAAIDLHVNDDNVIVVRAHGPSTGPAFAQLELAGDFGRAGTSARWRAIPAAATEAHGPAGPWTRPGYDDSAWSAAKELPPGAELTEFAGGPARAVWSSTAASDILLRLSLYVPAGLNVTRPAGFGRDTTGGEGGESVTVTTPSQLTAALEDDQKRVIRVQGTLDFTGSEGTASAPGCYVTKCKAPLQSELITNQLGACDTAGMGTFNVTFDKAGMTPLAVRSNKTIVGLGSDATLKGKGLSMRGGVSNIIVRNLTIANINPQLVWGGDAITLDGADRVWLDHLRIALVGRQMLLTGYGNATHVTVSYTEFDGRTPFAAYCNGAHYYVWLLVGMENTLTFVNNWVHHTSGRAPHAGGAADQHVLLHMIDNLFEDCPGHALNPSTSMTKLLLEGNMFENVMTPIQLDQNTAPGLVYAPLESASSDASVECQRALGRPCVPNVASPQSGVFPLDTQVLTAFTSADEGHPLPYPAAAVVHFVPHLAGPGHLEPPGP